MKAQQLHGVVGCKKEEIQKRMRCVGQRFVPSDHKLWDGKALFMRNSILSCCSTFTISKSKKTIIISLVYLLSPIFIYYLYQLFF